MSTAALRVAPIQLPFSSASADASALPTSHAPQSATSNKQLSVYAAEAFVTQSAPPPAPIPRLRSPGRAFRDPAAVGAFLAGEGALARIQAKHRAYVDRDRDSDDEDALDDAYMRGMAQSDSKSSSTQVAALQAAQNAKAATNLKLNRKMGGVLTEEFFGCLRATEREMEMDDKKETALKRAREAHQQRQAASIAAATAAAAETQFKPGPLTRALLAKQNWKDAAEARKAQFKARQSRKSGMTHAQEDDDDAEIEGLSRLALERKRKDDLNDLPLEDESAHHRLFLPDCIVPPSITYLKGQAIAWYFSSSVDSSVKRKHSRNLRADRIIECMTASSHKTPWQSERPIEIVSVFYHSEAHLNPIYMDRDRMESFVRTDAQVLRPSGVLQKFVPPASEYNNMLRVTWTPSMCLVERRTSGYKLGSNRIRLDDRIQTYEVSTGLGVEVREELVHESSMTRKVIQQTCAAIAEHFAIVHGQTIAGQQSKLSMLNSLQQSNHGCHPLKMTLYFKLAGHNQLYLLLCDELKWSKLDMDELELELVGRKGNTSSSNDTAETSAPFGHKNTYKPALGSIGPGSYAHAGVRNKAIYGSARSVDSDDARDSLTTRKPSHMRRISAALAQGNAPQLTDGLDIYAHKRRRLAENTHSRKGSLASLAFAAPAGSAASQNVAPAAPTSLNRKKKADLKCGHCGHILTIFNSHIQSGSQLSVVAPPGPGQSQQNMPHSSKPYVDLRSLLLYRLSLCAYLLPPAAVKRLDTPSGVAASQKIYAEFLWNLARPVLIPYYMADEKEFKIHIFFQAELERDAVKAEAEAANRQSTLTHALMQRQQVTSSGYAQKKKEEKPKGPQISIWDIKIYACKSCAHLVRSFRRGHDVALGLSPSKPSKPPAKSPSGGASTSEVLEELWLLLIESYIEHQKLIPPTTIDLALVPHSTGVPAVLAALPDEPGGAMYRHAPGGGFLRSTNPYMVEQTYLEREQAAAIKRQIIAHAQCDLSDAASPDAASSGDSLEKSLQDQGWMSPMSPAAYFARGATAPPTSYTIPPPIGECSDEEDETGGRLDEWTVPTPGDRVRLALAQDEADNGLQPSAIERYEPELEAAAAPPPTKKEREKARLERLAEREARKARAEQQRLEEEWHAAQAELLAKEPFQHVKGKLHHPIGQDQEQRLARELRRAERARQAAIAASALEAADGHSSDGSIDEARLIDDHETILRKLASIDPVRAEYLRSRTMPQSPSVAPQVKLVPAYHPDTNHSHHHTREEEQREVERLTAQLRSWYKRQVEREAQAFDVGHHAARHDLRTAFDDEVDGPQFDASSPAANTRELFGSVAPERPNHHRRFGSYLGGKVFVSAGQGMDEREGLGFSGLGLGQSNLDHFTGSGSPRSASRASNTSTNGAPSRVRSAGFERSTPSPASIRSHSSQRPRAQSAAVRRPPSKDGDANSKSSSIPGTQVAPTRVASASASRPRTAVRPISPGTRREMQQAALADHGFNNAHAFATRTSPYQRADERARELNGFVPAGWDSNLHDAYSTKFGKNNSVAGTSALHKPIAPRSSKKKKKSKGAGSAPFQDAYARRMALLARVELTPPRSPIAEAAHQRRSMAPSASEPILEQAAPESAIPPPHAPPKSLAVFASAASVGLSASESQPVLKVGRHQHISSRSRYDDEESERNTPAHRITAFDRSNSMTSLSLSQAQSRAQSAAASRSQSRSQSRHSTARPHSSVASSDDERDEADAYEIDDAPIFESESDDEAAERPTRMDILTEPSDEQIASAEAMLFK